MGDTCKACGPTWREKVRNGHVTWGAQAARDWICGFSLVRAGHPVIGDVTGNKLTSTVLHFLS
jgi:hypothetical protein